MSIWRFSAALVAAIVLSGQAAPNKYAEGQVWAYKTRPQDAGSLIKIQIVEEHGGSPAYHIGVVGIHFANPHMAGILPHIPVSATTLDASVTHLAAQHPEFPTVALQKGIAEWRAAKGGVFTIPISEIVEVADNQTR